MKKVLLYSPYLHILGGGERHILSIMQIFDNAGYQVDIVCDDMNILRAITNRLHIDFKHAKIIPNFFATNSVLTKLLITSKYDYLFYVTDGSYFLSRAKSNYIFAMYPQSELYNEKFVNRLKLLNFSIVSNGSFTAEYIDRWFGKDPGVIHPYIDAEFFKLLQSPKKKIILSVGRFYDHLHAKRQDVLIEAFKKLQKKNKAFKDYSLILSGGFDEADRMSLEKLMKFAGKDPKIRFVLNPSFTELLDLYKDAQLYWHAAGYGVNEKREPYKVEHLGITPLEAMAAGCVVFAHNSGGPKRLINEGITGYLYDDIDELVEKTRLLVVRNYNQKMRNDASNYVEERFSYKAFERNVKNYFKI